MSDTPKTKEVRYTKETAVEPEVAKEAPKAPVGAQITMSPDQFQMLINSAVTAAVQAATQGMMPNASPQEKDKLTTSLIAAVNKRNTEGQIFFNKLANSKRRVRFRIDETYSDYLGSALTVTLNGSTIKVPVDGKTYYIEPVYIPIINERLKNVVEQRRRNKNTASFSDGEGDFAQV